MMDDEELTRLAIAEILREAEIFQKKSEAAFRALRVKDPVKVKPNTNFLKRTIRDTLYSNKLLNDKKNAPPRREDSRNRSGRRDRQGIRARSRSRTPRRRRSRSKLRRGSRRRSRKRSSSRSSSSDDTSKSKGKSCKHSSSSSRHKGRRSRDKSSSRRTRRFSTPPPENYTYLKRTLYKDTRNDPRYSDSKRDSSRKR